MDTMALDNAKVVSLATFKRDGTAVAGPIWLAGTGGTYDMMTGDDSWKLKRIRNNPAVQLQICDFRGNVEDGAEVYDGKAEILDGPDSDAALAAVNAKYGWQAKLMGRPMEFLYKLRRKPPTVYVGLRVTIS